MVRISGFLLGILFCFQTAFSQDYSYAFLVEFTDKNQTAYSVDNPLEFLSQRAIDRREKYDIAITDNDFPVNDFYVDSLKYYSGVFHNSSKWFNSAVYYTNNSAFNEDVQNISFVQNVRLVYTNFSLKSSTNKNKFQSENNISMPADFDYGESYDQIAMCNGQVLHNQGYAGQGMQIAVLDAGFKNADEVSCFDSLFQNNRILGTYDFVKNETSVYEDHYHGMNVLSILAANIPGLVMGTAPKASYWLLRSEDDASEFPIEEENWIFAAEFADSAGVDVITTSLGYSVFDDADMSYVYADMDGETTRITQGAEKAFSKGIFVVSSAGNEGGNSWKYLTAPSDGEHIMCIGAVNQEESIAYFSSQGPSADGRVKPDVCGVGAGTILVNPDGSDGSGSGTSFSCPLIAGLSTCLWQAFPDLSNMELLDLIRSCADSYDNPNNYYGYGIPDYAYAIDMMNDTFIKDNTKSQILNVYPNPLVSDLSFNLYIDKEQTINIVLFDLLGNKLFSQSKVLNTTSTAKIKIQGLDILERGAYVLTVYTNTGVLTSIVVKK
ncbi:MAG: S8 family serine peptidase [Salinivirgaceae bacterium]|nr:S8 family serine peptidase [Salinivirgaceae bacterium]